MIRIASFHFQEAD